MRRDCGADPRVSWENAEGPQPLRWRWFSRGWRFRARRTLPFPAPYRSSPISLKSAAAAISGAGRQFTETTQRQPPRRPSARGGVAGNPQGTPRAAASRTSPVPESMPVRPAAETGASQCYVLRGFAAPHIAAFAASPLKREIQGGGRCTRVVPRVYRPTPSQGWVGLSVAVLLQTWLLTPGGSDFAFQDEFVGSLGLPVGDF